LPTAQEGDSPFVTVGAEQIVSEQLKIVGLRTPRLQARDDSVGV